MKMNEMSRASELATRHFFVIGGYWKIWHVGFAGVWWGNKERGGLNLGDGKNEILSEKWGKVEGLRDAQ